MDIILGIILMSIGYNIGSTLAGAIVFMTGLYFIFR